MGRRFLQRAVTVLPGLGVRQNDNFVYGLMSVNAHPCGCKPGVVCWLEPDLSSGISVHDNGFLLESVCCALHAALGVQRSRNRWRLLPAGRHVCGGVQFLPL